MATPEEIRHALAEPFHPDQLEWRPGATNREKTSALALAYVTARAVMDRLDEVVGIDGWEDEYRPGPAGGVVCRLKVTINGFPITKEDAADNSDIESVKGGISDALKRAAVKFGIGRYLYGLDAQWTPFDGYRFTQMPRLPDWALPEHLRSGRPNPSPGLEIRPETQRSAPQTASGVAQSLPDLPEVRYSNISTALRTLGLTDTAERLVAIGRVVDVPESALIKGNVPGNVEAAVREWAMKNGHDQDPLGALVEAVRSQS